MAFLGNFWPKIAQKRRKLEVVDFCANRCGFSQKSPNLHYLTIIFGVFEQFLAKPHLVTPSTKGTEITEGYLYLGSTLLGLLIQYASLGRISKIEHYAMGVLRGRERDLGEAAGGLFVQNVSK